MWTDLPADAPRRRGLCVRVCRGTDEHTLAPEDVEYASAERQRAQVLGTQRGPAWHILDTHLEGKGKQRSNDESWTLSTR